MGRIFPEEQEFTEFPNKLIPARLGSPHLNLDPIDPAGTPIGKMESIPASPAAFGVGFLRENVLGSLGALGAMSYVDQSDEGFDPYADPAYLRGYEQHIIAFAGVRNRAHGDYLKRQIDEQRQELDILEASGGIGFAGQMLGAIFDPSSFLPISKFKTFVGAVTAEEMVRQAAQPTRTGEEAFLTIGASTMMAGIMSTLQRRMLQDRGVQGGGGGGDTQLLLEDMRNPPPRPPNPAGDAETAFNSHLRDVRQGEEAAAARADGRSGSIEERMAASGRKDADDTLTLVGRATFNFQRNLGRGIGKSTFEGKNAGTMIRDLSKQVDELVKDIVPGGTQEARVTASKEMIKIIDENRLLLDDMFNDVDAIVNDLKGIISGEKIHSRRTPAQEILEPGAPATVWNVIIEGTGFDGFPVFGTKTVEASSAAEAIARVEREGDFVTNGHRPDDGGTETVRIKVKGISKENTTGMVHAQPVEIQSSFPSDDSVGSSRAPDAIIRTEQDELGLLTMLPSAFLDKLPDTPFKRVMTSSDLLSREIALELADNSYFLNQHREGIKGPQSVEADMRQWWHPASVSIMEMNRQYDLYRGGIGSVKLIDGLRRGVSDLFRGTDEAMDIYEFRSEVGTALHNGDVHEIPEVQASAQHMRKVYDRFKQALMDEEVLTKPIVRRIAEIDKNIRKADSPRAIEILKKERKRQEADLARLETEGPQMPNSASFAPLFIRHDVVQARRPEFEAKLRDHYRSRGMTGPELDDAVRETTDRLLRESPFIKIEDDMVGKARSLHERTLDIDPNDFLEFLELDAEMMLRHYTRTVSADLELTRRFGSNDLAEEIDEIRQRYNVRIVDARGVKEKRQLEKERDRNVDDLRAIRDRLRGSYGLPDDPFRPWSRFVRGMKQLNYTVFLGGVAISSIPDLARLTMTEGLDRAFRDAYLPLIRDLKGLKMSGHEGKLAGVSLEMELGFRAMAFADLGDTFSRHNKLERALQGGASVFSLINLFNPWNAAMKGMASSIVSHRIIEDAIFTSKPSLRSASVKVVMVEPGTLRSQRATAAETKRLDAIDHELAELDFNIREIDEALGEDILDAADVPKFQEKLDGLIADRAVLIEETIEIQKGRKLSAKYDPKTNTVKLDQQTIDKSYRDRAWHDAKVEGVDGMSDDLIRNKKDWVEFLTEHEMAHADFKILDDELYPAYENRINRVAQNRMLTKRYRRATKKSKFGTEKLARAGIDAPMAERIAAQFNQHGQWHKELMLPFSEDWLDKEAQHVFRNALGMDVDRIIVTPGAGDTPLWLSTEIGGLIGQFKSFSMASAQKVLIPGIQQRDSHVLMGTAMMVGMGMIVDEIKRWQFDIDTDPSMTERIMRGIDRSGVTAYFSDIDRIIESVSDNQLGLSAMLGIAPPFRPSFKSKAGAIGGPTASQLGNLASILTDSMTGNWNYHTAGALRRMLPGMNVLWLNPAYDLIEEGAAF